MMTGDLFGTLVQPHFEEHRADWLAEARAIAFDLAQRNGTVTIDDVRALCPPPADVDPRVMGAVFRTRDFRPTGKHRKSARSICHNRPVAIFELAP